jgi:protein-disulfide isomerase
VGALYDSVAFGRLKNKVTLCVKPIGTAIGDIALMAANGDNKFWNLFLAMKGIKTRISEDIAIHLADSIGIAPGRFREMIKNPQIPKLLEANKLEANRNNVVVTPTFFINGRRYSSYTNPLWVVDDALYEIDRK